MSNWKSPLLGRRVQVVYNTIIWDEKPKHWWSNGKSHNEDQVFYEGEVVDRASNSAEYLIACDDGKMRWVWSSSLRLL